MTIIASGRTLFGLFLLSCFYHTSGLVEPATGLFIDGSHTQFSPVRPHQKLNTLCISGASRYPTFLSEQQKSDEVERTSFDQAGKSLIDEEDRQRMEQMGDFDQNPAYSTDSIEKMRAAIRARTTDLGLEKSKISAEYVQQRKEQALSAGPGQKDNDQFGGLDLSRISSTPTASKSEWNEDMPSMFYDPEDELSKEEQEEVDPMMKKNVLEQALHELSNAKWPDVGSALREVALLFVVVAFSAVVIIGWDKLLRIVYTDLGFIPTKDEIANYASRFEGLDLPSGWTNNMNDQDVAQFTDTVSSSSLPDL